MQDSILKHFLDFGAIGLIAAACVYQVSFMTKKLFSVIENNTRAVTELSTLIKENLKNCKG